jgi:hypothetical protein
MNIFDLSTEDILEKFKPPKIDLLPGVPALLSRQETAFVLSVSVQTVNRMIAKGDLTPNDEEDILKTDLVGYISTHTLADRPILGDEK